MSVRLEIIRDRPIGLSVSNRQEVLRMSTEELITVTEKDYENLRNKPSIEGVELIGDKSFEELNLQRITNTELENMLTL